MKTLETCEAMLNQYRRWYDDLNYKGNDLTNKLDAIEKRYKALDLAYAIANGRIVELEIAVRYAIVDLKYQDPESAQKKLEALAV